MEALTERAIAAGNRHEKVDQMEARDTQPLEGRRQRGMRERDETLSHSPRNYSNWFSCTLIWPAAIKIEKKKNFDDNLSLLFLVIQREDNEDCDFYLFYAATSTAQKSWQKGRLTTQIDLIISDVNKTDKDQMTGIYVNVHVGTASESFRGKPRASLGSKTEGEKNKTPLSIAAPPPRKHTHTLSHDAPTTTSLQCGGSARSERLHCSQLRNHQGQFPAFCQD